jgi:hypothetical protein
MTVAEETETIIYDPEGGEHVLFSQKGHPIHDDVNAKVQEFVWTTISEAFEYSNRHGESIPAEQSLHDFFRERVQQTKFSDEEKEICLDACKLWGAYVGDQVDRQSLKFFRLEECVDGSKCFVSIRILSVL